MTVGKFLRRRQQFGSSQVVWLSRKQTYEVQAVLIGFHTVMADDYFSLDPSLETY